MEKSIQIAIDTLNRIIEARAALKQILGGRYAQTVNPVARNLRLVSMETGKTPLAILCELMEKEPDPHMRLLLMAAALEAYE